MTFRRRVIVMVAVAVATAIVLGSVATYVIVRHDLRDGLDRQLEDLFGGVLVKTTVNLKTSTAHNTPKNLTDRQVAQIGQALAGAKGRRQLSSLLGPRLAADVVAAVNSQIQEQQHSVQVPLAARTKLVLPQTRLELPAGYAQFVSPAGKILDPAQPSKQLLPVTKGALVAANHQSGPFFSDMTVAGLHVRVLTAPVTGGAVQAAVSAVGVDDTLNRLAVVLVLVSLGGIGLAVAMAVLVGRAALTPVATLTTTTERVSRTKDLSERLAVRGDDELARLSMSFNRMLAALEASSAAQRQLVADASHELRTPLASLLMNIELLGEDGRLPSTERERVIADLTEQVHELTVLVGDLVDLARDEPIEIDAEVVRLDEIVGDAVGRAERHARGQRFVLESEATIVVGVAQRLERAVNNLLDNALKWNPAGEPIEVSVREGRVTVRDHGPGFAPQDLPYVFDRFYRATRSRGLPGAGLGLSIVRQVAMAHGGTIEAANAAGGGALLTMRLPPAKTLSESLPVS